MPPKIKSAFNAVSIDTIAMLPGLRLRGEKKPGCMFFIIFISIKIYILKIQQRKCFQKLFSQISFNVYRKIFVL